jgi:hypothetical protein
MSSFVASTWAIWSALIAILSPPHVISNNCEQAYRLLLKEAEQNVFWIAEDIYGECSQSNLIQVNVDVSNAIEENVRMPNVIIRKTALKEFNSWSALEQVLKQTLQYETPLEILPVNGTLSIDILGVKLRTPERNRIKEKMYQLQFPFECADKWNAGMLKDAIDLPIITNNKVCRLLFFSPNGLYFNYQIDKAYYFAESRLILIFTKNNSYRCNSEISSMHGFMILRIANA